ncbi:hypothetical protein T484DRAFT_1874113, partial [Baffinella frigidus]
MDGDTTIVGPGEEKTENCGGGVKKKKKLAEKKCKCKVDGCNKSYRSQGELQQHVDFTHNGIYHNVCDHIDEDGAKCRYKCELPGNLERHKRHKHSDVCDHQCTDCTKTFKTAHHRDEHWVSQHSAANDHRRTEHKCEWPDGLDSHKRKHNDVYDHKCTDCTATFKTKHEYDVHWTRKHSPPDHPARTEYKCGECPAGFPTSGDLASHHLHNHGPKDDPRLVAKRKAEADR